MIIDMGGGTVDMTIHKIDTSLGGDAVSLSELTNRECLAEVGPAASMATKPDVGLLQPSWVRIVPYEIEVARITAAPAAHCAVCLLAQAVSTKSTPPAACMAFV